VQKSTAQYIAQAKAAMGNAQMSDREFGERLGELGEQPPYAQQTIAKAKSGNCSDPLAVRVAEVLKIEPGEVIWVARMEREKDPAVRMHLETWGRFVKKALASVPTKAVSALGALTVALGMLMPAPDAHAVGGAGRFR
jgi:hypothetical protein